MPNFDPAPQLAFATDDGRLRLVPQEAVVDALTVLTRKHADALTRYVRVLQSGGSSTTEEAVQAAVALSAVRKLVASTFEVV